MSAPTQYGPPNGQQAYGPPQGQPGPQYNGPQQYGPPANQPPQGQPLGSPVQQAGEDASGFFNGAAGAASLSFPQGETGVWKGGIFTGVIATKQATTMKTATKPSEPRFWPSGDPVNDVIVELITNERDANNPLDDGRRRMFVTQEDTHIQDSKSSVTKEATKAGFHRGGQIYWRRSGYRQGTQLQRGVWECSYTPPTAETLAVLDRMPPQGVSQAAANEVAAQASQPNGGNPYQAPAGQQGPPQSYQPAAAGPPPQYQGQPPAQNYGPPNGQQGLPPGYTPADQQGYQQYGPPPSQQPGYQPAPAGPPPQYQGQPPAQSYGPPAGMYGPNGGPPPQGPPPQYQAPAAQPEQNGPPPWQGQQAPAQPGYQQGAPQQTQNPYYQQ